MIADARDRSINEMINGGYCKTDSIGTSDEVLEDEELQEN